MASDREGCDNVVLCRGYGDVQQWVVGSGHCCSYLWVGLASGAIEVLEAMVCTGLGVSGPLRFCVCGGSS
jgi:hypothetical protein